MKIVTVIGTRPQFIKAAPLSKKLQGLSTEILVNTGQHYDYEMSDIFIKELNLPVPDYNLQVGSSSHGKQTSQMLSGLEEIYLKEKPDFVLVYGDTNSTLAGSLAAAKLNIPIAHVESGLRSFNKKMPEEVNRVLTDHISSYLFCPTKNAVTNLKAENITNNVFCVGDVMYDSILHFQKSSQNLSNILDRLKLTEKEYYLMTIHRAENTDNQVKLRNILEAISKMDKTVVFPAHPRTKKNIAKFNLNHFLLASNIKLIDPLSYFEMITIEEGAKVILTDSGGVQKEAYMLKVPCITIRDETEWIETTNNGWNVLCDADVNSIIYEVNSVKTPIDYNFVFGDGKASEKIVKILLS